MPDHRRHRGPHPQDAALFSPEWLSALRLAAEEFAYLLTRGYATDSALKLVGDRHALRERQRTAVRRSTCSDDALRTRKAKRIDAESIGGRSVWIDGYNLLTTIEAAIAGGVILIGRDGTCRDMASMHGTWRKTDETQTAIELIGHFCAARTKSDIRWLLDRPVSNSGRLATLLRESAEAHEWNWMVDLVPDPDPILAESDAVVVSADSVILDRCDTWWNVAAELLAEFDPQPWTLDFVSSIG